MYLQLYVKELVFQGKCRNNHSQLKGVNKEKCSRITRVLKDTLYHNKALGKLKVVWKCNNSGKIAVYCCIFAAENCKCRVQFNLGEHSKLTCIRKGGSGCLMMLIFRVYDQLFAFKIFICVGAKAPLKAP